LVLAARSGKTLSRLAKIINEEGGEAIAVTADVGDPEQVANVAIQALRRFGRIDTWINDAGVSIYGKLEETSIEDARRLFDTNFWGVVYGSLAAVPHLKKQGGALINVGSEVSDAVVSLQGMYSASKHAVKGFTDALRVELEVEDAPVSVTLIQPTAVDTPYPQHARNYMSQEPKLPTPQIEPEKAAEEILAAAEKPKRDVRVGTQAKLNVVTARIAPKLGDKLAGMQTNRQQYDEAPRHPEGTLYQSGEAEGTSGHVHGSGPAH
jgi:short-subunit dehydrogenase